jgi:hypothetical protein
MKKTFFVSTLLLGIYLSYFPQTNEYKNTYFNDPIKGNSESKQQTKSTEQLHIDYSYLEKPDIPKTVEEASNRLRNMFNYALGIHRLEENDIKNIIDVYNNGLKSGDPKYDEKVASVKKAFEIDNSGFLYNAIGKVANYPFDFSNPDKVRKEYDELIRTLVKYKIDPEAVKQYSDIGKVKAQYETNQSDMSDISKSKLAQNNNQNKVNKTNLPKKQVNNTNKKGKKSLEDLIKEGWAFEEVVILIII